jgi:hypothetical protein
MNIRPIAFYLPQFHPIPENDEWWGKGFTEWTNVGKAKPLFRGHDQPRVPADLGYYDLRLPETRQAQADLARRYGIEGFCYWHYWFGNGKRLLQRPFDEVLESGKPDFPFCLGWANETWSGIWHGLSDRILAEQTYPGKDDFIDHYNLVRKAFTDKRYIKVDDKPLFVILNPLSIKELKQFISLWNDLAKKDGFEGVHFAGNSNSVRHEKDLLIESGLNGIICNRLSEACSKDTLIARKIYNKLFEGLKVHDYKNVMKNLVGEEERNKMFYPVAMPNWDHSPRAGKNSLIITNSTPELFEKHLSDICERIENKAHEHKIVFIKSWNEWAEGNYLEPDLVHGHKYLEAVRKIFGQA